ncbi:MAG: YceI family protein [Pseudomonadota bacterium]
MVLLSRFFMLVASCFLLVPHTASADMAMWVVDSSKSTLGFTGTEEGKNFKGVFERFSSDIQFSPDKLDSSHIKVTVETASAHTGEKAYDSSIAGGDWFNSNVFPQAIFEARGFKDIGQDKEGLHHYEAAGKLTLLGVTKDLTLPFSLKKDGKNTRAFGSIVLKRLDFGLGAKADATASMVADNVTVNFDITAHN